MSDDDLTEEEFFSSEKFLYIERPVLVLFFIVFLVSLGEQLWAEFVSAYFVALGGSIFFLGVFKSLSDVLDAIAQYPGGLISDRFGRFQAVMLFLAFGVFGYATYLLASSWKVLFVGLIFVQGTSSLLQPTIFAMIGDFMPSRRRTSAFSVQSILKRVPIIVSPALGGYIIASQGVIEGMRIGLGITVVLSVLSLFFAKLMLGQFMNSSSWKEKVSNQNGSEVSIAPGSIVPTSFFSRFWIDKGLFRLLIADIFARLGQAIVKAFIVLHVIEVLGPQEFGILISIQMTVSVLSYIPAAGIANRVGKKPVAIVSFLCFSLYPAFILYSDTLFWLILAFGVAGFREFGEPARKAILVDLAPTEKRAQSIGLYYTFRSLSVVPGSIIGALLWTISHQLTGLIASLIAFIGLLFFICCVHETE